MNAETVLSVWMDERVSMGAIARLFETDLVSVEDGIRAELRRLRSEAADAMGIELNLAPAKYRQYQQDVLDQARQTIAKLPGPIDNALFGPIDTDEIKHHQNFQKRESAKQMTRGGHGCPDAETCKHPRRQRPAAKKSNGAVLDLSDYPEALRHPAATSQRAVWDALEIQCSMDELVRATGLASQPLYALLSTMRGRLLVHKRDADGKWERITEVPK